MDEAGECAGAREELDRVIKRSGETYSSISRLIGRNPTYIQQFIRRGVPARLEEPDIRRIAHALGIDPESIGGLPNQPEPMVAPAESHRPNDFVRIASIDPRLTPTLAFHAQRAAELASGDIEALALVRVEGDAMVPSLTPGDELLIDRDDAAARLRDGLYALRVEGELMVKRLAINPSSRRVTVMSDNPAYPVWSAEDLDRLDIVGRVVWSGHRYL